MQCSLKIEDGNEEENLIVRTFGELDSIGLTSCDWELVVAGWCKSTSAMHRPFGRKVLKQKNKTKNVKLHTVACFLTYLNTHTLCMQVFITKKISTE